MSGLNRGFLALLLVVLAAPAFAGGNSSGDCKIIGSWMGYDSNGNVLMSTADGQSAESGTSNLEVPGSIAGCPAGTVGMTEFRGVWRKTGRREYEWTVIGTCYDEIGTTLAVGKLSGIDIIEPDCDAMLVAQSALEMFAPWQNPFVDPPLFVKDLNPHYVYRIRVDLYEFE